MSGKLFNFLCSQLERKNSRRTIDLSVNLIFRRIHVYQNGHVPIYRFPSVFFIFFFSKGVFYVDKWHNISNRTGLEPVSALNFLLYDKDYFTVNKFSPYFYLKKQRFFVENLFVQATKVAYYRFLELFKSSINFFNRVCLD